MPRKKKTYLTEIESMKGSDDLFVKIPDEILREQDWRVGDVLECVAKPGGIFLSNKSKNERQSRAAQGQKP